MEATTRKRLQIFLVALFVLAAIRLAMIWNERREAKAPAQPRVEGKLPADYYVVPKKTYAFDLPSLRKAVVGQPVWVRDGYRWTYFPFDPATHRADFRHPAGTLGPLEQLDIQEIATGVSPEAPDQKQVLAAFSRDGKDYAFSVGAEKGDETKIYIDEMVYIEDPHQLYKHWSSEVWDAIAYHQVKPGMNQLQADFAVGVGYPGAGDINNRTVHYPNGGSPLDVTYENDRAVNVAPAAR